MTPDLWNWGVIIGCSISAGILSVVSSLITSHMTGHVSGIVMCLPWFSAIASIGIGVLQIPGLEFPSAMTPSTTHFMLNKDGGFVDTMFAVACSVCLHTVGLVMWYLGPQILPCYSERARQCTVWLLSVFAWGLFCIIFGVTLYYVKIIHFVRYLAAALILIHVIIGLFLGSKARHLAPRTWKAPPIILGVNAFLTSAVVFLCMVVQYWNVDYKWFVGPMVLFTPAKLSVVMVLFYRSHGEIKTTSTVPAAVLSNLSNEAFPVCFGALFGFAEYFQQFSGWGLLICALITFAGVVLIVSIPSYIAIRYFQEMKGRIEQQLAHLKKIFATQDNTRSTSVSYRNTGATTTTRNYPRTAFSGELTSEEIGAEDDEDGYDSNSWVAV